MNTFDAVNAGFEIAGGLTTWFNVAALWHDKVLRGVRWYPTALYTAWGAWNCLWYPHLHQWLSFFGGLFIFAANIAWLSLVFKFWRQREGI